MPRVRAWLASKNIASDFFASIVVFLVALPLCMGIAIACGAPPAAGLLTGIVAGLVVAFLSGCPLQVSGPAAGLVVIVADLIRDHGFNGLAVVLVIAGLVQIIAGALRLGRLFSYVSPAVVHGMLSGIGALIIFSQFPIMVTKTEAAIVGAVTIAMMFLWNKIPVERLRQIPAPLAAVLGGSVLCAFLGKGIDMVSLPANLFDAIQLPPLSVLGLVSVKLVFAGLGLALIASAETMLTAAALDKMKAGPPTQYNRELMSQGVGNILCGLIGALPMTGVIVRSGVNVQAGAKTRLSAVLHGIWLLALVSLFPQLLMLIPIAALAAVLVYTGFKLLDVKAVKQLYKDGGWSDVAVFAVTFGVVVWADLLTGVIAGQLLATAFWAYRRWLKKS